MSDDSDCFRDMFAQQYDFMKKGTFTDISFRVGGAKIGAHKAVLASCSQVFRAMFETDMKESQTEEVDISDVDPEAFRVFLDYIYSRKYENIEKHLGQLFMLADKYDIQPLVNGCERIMKNSLNMENAFDYLQIADLYRRDESKESIIDYIKGNLGSVVSSDKWAELKSENPSLVSTVILSLIDDRSSPSKKIDSFYKVDLKFCDAVVKIGKDEFPVHTFLLAEKSAKFSALFEGDTKECHVEGVTAADFKVLMHYVYAEKLPENHLVNEGILKAAHKFELQSLMDHCVAVLKSKLELDNVVPTLICAKSLQLSSLKTSAMDFIIENLDDVKERDNWREMSKYPDLLMEVYLKTY